MKIKNGFILTFILSPFFLFSQIVIDKSINPTAGNCIENYQFDLDVELAQAFVMNGLGKDKHIWNFRNLDIPDEKTIDSVCYLNVNETPYFEHFPDANLAMTWNDKSSYDYFHFSENGYKLVGSVEIYEDDSLVDIQNYKNSDMQIPYPFTYFDTLADVIDASGESIRIINGKSHKKRTHTAGKFWVEGIGQGKLILPYKTFDSVVVVAITTNAVDTSFYLNKIKKQKISATTIFWFSPNSHCPLFTVWIDNLTNTASGQYAYLMKKNLLTNTKIHPFLMSVYPNPGKDEITIDYALKEPQNVRIYVNNILGQRVKEVLNEFQSLGEYKKNMNVTDLTEGLYFICIEANEKIESIKWLKY